MIKAACDAGKVEIVTDCRVQDVTLDGEFLVSTSQGTYRAKALVVATGGLSIPKIGATDIGYRIARKFGLKIQPCRPALVPLLYPEHVALAGVATEVIASFNGQAFREKLLITHRGLSGPAILQISSYWDGRGAIDINLLPSVGIEAELLGRKQRGEKAEVRSVLAEYLPRRLAERWAQGSGPLIVAGNKAIVQLTENLHRWRVLPTGTEGYEKAEVTGGGVDTGELSAKTMEARKVPGLYFIGEVVDVTGQLEIGRASCRERV